MIRQTVAADVRLEGLGLHSGEPVIVRILPGEDGIRFRYRSSVVPAIPENVSDTNRSTRLGEISTIEHLMSAFAGLRITDAEIELTAPELPGLDGSSREYAKALRAAGFAELCALELPDLFTRVFEQGDSVNIAVSKGTGHWSYRFVTDGRWPGEMAFEVQDVVASYETEIAPARTFAFCEEVPLLLEAGLGQGLNKDSALILGERDYEGPARFPDEPARHKLLDLIGDLYLSGVPIDSLNVTSERSGHTSNVRAAAKLRSALFPS
ncbi:MAG: UDP-3-O-[3-hydroxymyristoyl] N-acetylglucosamine deacetylase [Fimbriimonadaceae bacterium]|jgi:UDP-3-O-acyl-N-acetylglucosamine deacetylase|nr:UDP-3-O-[3-hydroxymyristoyl] N-acetylglucosamine deacetylase [Fimbriimonadaceae bacterium]